MTSESRYVGRVTYCALAEDFRETGLKGSAR